MELLNAKERCYWALLRPKIYCIYYVKIFSECR